MRGRQRVVMGVVAPVLVAVLAASGPVDAPAAAGVPSAAPAPVVAAGTGTGAAEGPRLRPCPAYGPRALCGTLRRAWDPTGAVGGQVGIGFVLVPPRNRERPALGTVVAHEGGPGYPATGSAASYRALFHPLLARRTLLLVDQRGTGRSAPVDCPELQELVGSYADAAETCGERLGERAHLYGTELAADDLAAVVRALGLGPVDLYGDSYGTFFAQVVLGRHPELVRTITLDAAYPTFGEDAWYATQAPALRHAIDVTCERGAWCGAQTGDPVDRLDQLLGELRVAPITGVAPGGDGQLHRVTLDPAALARVAYNGTYAPTTYRELDATVRAALAGDRLPLLRLLAEADHPGGRVSPPQEYSEGHDAAVTCRDYPQVVDLTADRATREAQLEAAVRVREHTEPRTYAPFSVREQVASGWMTIDWCLGWPVPPASYPPRPPEPPGGTYADVPALVLSGELDTITTPAEGRLVAEHLPGATWVEVANGLHVAALEDLDGCAERVVRRFVRTAAVGDVSCLGAQPPLRTAPPFWRALADVVPADPAGNGSVAGADPATDGSVAGADRLRAASVAAATTGDALARWWQSYASGGRGLRGGTWRSSGYREVRVVLEAYRLVGDVAVTGTARWDRARGAVRAELHLDGPTEQTTGDVVVAWDALDPEARATVTGTLGGTTVEATVTAP